MLAVFLVGWLLVFRSIGENEALRDARQYTALTGQGIVEPALGAGVMDGDQAALRRLDTVVQERVLGERVVRVKIWAADGRIVYSDEPRLIGVEIPARRVEARGAARRAERRRSAATSAGPRTASSKARAACYEVYLPIRAPDGTPLLFETYQRGTSVASTGRRIWLPFAALLLASLVLLWLVQVPLAWRLARRLRRSQVDREMLLVRAVEASDDERAPDRRRPPRRRRAGPRRDLVLAQRRSRLGRAAGPAGDSLAPRGRRRPGRATACDASARCSSRSILRTCGPAGLEAALGDLLAPLAGRGIETSLDVADGLDLDEETEQLFYRAAGEAIRNVERHADARHLAVRVGTPGRAGVGWR